jgi:peptidoglycan/LPS O-acetylase OafA/YrhL
VTDPGVRQPSFVTPLLYGGAAVIVLAFLSPPIATSASTPTSSTTSIPAGTPRLLPTLLGGFMVALSGMYVRPWSLTSW